MAKDIIRNKSVLVAFRGEGSQGCRQRNKNKEAMNYYKIDNATLKADGIATFAHLTNGRQTVVSDMDVRRAVGFELSPTDIQTRYGIAPLTAKEIASVRRAKSWTFNRKEATL